MKDCELSVMADVLRILTIAYLENNTDCIAETYRYAYRTIGEFGQCISCLASEKAYYDFYSRTGQDIRMFKRDQKVKDKFGKSFVVHKEYKYEHLIPAVSLKNHLTNLYEQNNLNVDTIKQKILEQKMCWITIEENEKLNQLGYQYKNRETLEKAKQAYIKADIKIMD